MLSPSRRTPGHAVGDDQPRDIVAPDFAAIDRFLDAELRATGIPGAAWIIVHRGRVAHCQCFGVADRSGRPITPRTPFVLGSPGKGITALAVMQLVEQGKIALDAPITTYLPWLDTADRQAHTITVRHLLSHTSGISSRSGNQGTIYDGTADTALEDLVRRLRFVRLTRAPGTTYQYSNANFMIAGLIVQTVSGLSYEDYIRQRVFAPLGMTRSFLLQAEARQHGMAQGHHLLYGRAIPTNLPEDRGTLPAGLHVTCAEDMGRYLMALLNGGELDGARVLSAEGVKTMLSPVVSVAENDSYGLGWHVGAPNGVAAAWHDGVTTNFRSYVSLLPDLGYGVAILFNGDNSVQTARLDAIGRTVHSMILGAPPPRLTDDLVRSQWPLIVVGLAAAQIGWLVWSRRWLASA
ncbi:MAG: beta-lactamase family protein, partial [Dehalococcoidia bacterium]|nr:beta-lactamase family protein [Dehalococcoidia bacterium]